MCKMEFHLLPGNNSQDIYKMEIFFLYSLKFRGNSIELIVVRSIFYLFFWYLKKKCRHEIREFKAIKSLLKGKLLQSARFV